MEGAATAGPPHAPVGAGVFAFGGAFNNEGGGAAGIKGVALFGSPADGKGAAFVGGALENNALFAAAAAGA